MRYRLSKHKIAYYKNVGGHGPVGPTLATSMDSVLTNFTSCELA